MVSGSRGDSFYPGWFRDRVHKGGFVFITTDHGLTYPSTGFEIIDDMKALIAFLASSYFSEKYRPSGLSLDASRLAIMGMSGGGYGRAVFGMGGEFLSDHWLTVKTKQLDFPGSERATDELVALLLAHPPPVSSELTLRLLEDFKIADDEGSMNLFFDW
ncbi:hypothetical protein FOMPIDRAFT_1017701 [Fomitopsis schrenkii]|uniref:Peptidase S9 prolyl oligopeptidase catalytic domain-containing protein n=1 Tax=Fomitopsis schrenkii TaxID=2126942 RepID=S8FJC5_FOMSC|nr:hypothetical protein FOMPIDRAFT_1017701 [Fomitopsis schrenkii]